MNQGNILVVVVDGLRAAALGAYGNTAFATPSLDQLAAESFLFDCCFAPAAELSGVYRALWHSIHPLRPKSADDGALSLPQLFSAQGYATNLVTDEPALGSLPAAHHFDQQLQLGAAVGSLESGTHAEEFSQTVMARLFAAASDAVESDALGPNGRHDDDAKRKPRLIWIHSCGMYGPWDAPLDLQRSLLDEDDLPPVENVAPPDVLLTDADDSDPVFRYSCAYAAQIQLFDACWQMLTDAVRMRPTREPWLVVLLGARGFPLGEHRRVGGVDLRLYGEQLHVPWLMRFPDGHGRLARTHALATHADLLPTLLAWIGRDDASATTRFDGINLVPLITAANVRPRDALLSSSMVVGHSLRTDTWCLRHDAPTTACASTGEESMDSELFVRPDDRWEANDVAKLCPETVDTLAGAIAATAHQLAHDQPLPAKIVPGAGGGT